MKAAHEKLTKASHKLAEAHVQGEFDAAGRRVRRGRMAARPHTEQKKDEGVIDAEYVDVEDKK